MIYILLFEEQSRASQYGIGTYINQISAIIAQMKGCHLSMIFTRSNEKEFCVKKSNNVDCYYIPNILSDYDSDSKIKIYYKNIWYLIFPYLFALENQKVILHLNYYQHSCLLDGFYRYFPNGKSCFTLHYMDWCFKLMGNRIYLNNILYSVGIDQDNILKNEVLAICKKEKYLFDKLDKVICLSHNTRKLINDFYSISEQKTCTLYNGLRDDTKHLSSGDKILIRKSFMIEPDEKIILFVGRLDKIKGVDILIEAFKLVLTDYPNCRLFLVGDGFYSYYLNDCDPVWSRITFTGKLKKDKLYSLYQITDIGVLPSFHEQCSYVAIEMMMHGIPLVASTSTGLSEMIVDGVSGLQIPVIEYLNRTELNASDLSNKILMLLSDQPMRLRMGHQARLRYKEFYTSEILKYHMYEFYTSLVR